MTTQAMNMMESQSIPSTKDTIITINFNEENSQEDITYEVTDIETKMAEQASLEEASTNEEEESVSDCEEELQLEQVPIGVTEITSERKGKMTTGEMLVFNNTDEQVQTLNEVSFDSEDDEEEDKSFEPEEQDTNEENEASDTESIDQDDIKDIQVVENGDDMKLKFTDIEECRLKLQEEALSTEEITFEEENTQDYDEEADNDFNPTYCDQTLSDVEEPEDCPEEVPETIELDEDICMIRPDPATKIPPMEAESIEEGMEEDTMEESSQEKESMDCE